MQVTLQDIEKCKKEIRIEASWQEVQADYVDSLSQYLKHQIPGFRPGKAPQAMIEKVFMKEILHKMTSRCARRLCRVALEKEGVAVTGPLSVIDVEVEREKPFRCKAQFIALPKFDVSGYEQYRLSTKTDSEKRDEMSQWLLNHIHFDVPDELVKQELEFNGNDGIQCERDEWKAAFQRVKLLLILKEIAFNDGVEVDDQDLDERIAQLAPTFGIKESLLRQQLLQNGGLSRISNFLLAEKVLSYLLDRCS